MGLTLNNLNSQKLFQIDKIRDVKLRIFCNIILRIRKCFLNMYVSYCARDWGGSEYKQRLCPQEI